MDWLSYCCPFGAWIALPIVLQIIGTILYSVAAFSCKVGIGANIIPIYLCISGESHPSLFGAH